MVVDKSIPKDSLKYFTEEGSDSDFWEQDISVVNYDFDIGDTDNLKKVKQMDKCKGILGWLFGHKYEHIYDTLKYPIMEIDCQKLFWSYTYSGTQDKLIDSCIKTEKIYIKSICKRCGRVIELKENKESVVENKAAKE